MCTRLTIDEGNSSTKIALWRDGVIRAECTCREGTPEHIRQVAGNLLPVDALIFCTVCRRDRARTEATLAPFARKIIYLDAQTPLPIANDYRSPQTLGSDRIAGAIGAWTLHPDRTSLVVDMGTAITYDVVTADGRYIGGNIAPGIFVRLEALEHFTSALPAVETDGDVPRWGYDTETAMRAGCVRGVVGELQYYRHCLDPEATVVLTGGSADLITPFISSPVTVEPNLVLIGLNRIIDYNENT